MHFLSLAVLEIPEVQEDKERDREIAEALEELRIQKELKGRSIQTGLLMERLRGLLSAFSRTVDSCVSDLLYPYYESIPDTSYLEFDDRTEQLLAEYEGTADCVRLAQGTVVELFSYMLHGRFIIRDGKVFQRDAGPLRHEKRTKKAKRMKALPDYPLRKVYRDFKDYAENECGFTFDEEHQGYGFYYNPNAMWDWYSIGGRWPEMFLVKDTCEEYSLGERSWCNEDEELEAPEGYLWVCAARKKDALNERLRELVNPGGLGKPEIIRGKRIFRCGDKVMQIKNKDDVNNGDIGYIRNISGSGEDTTVQVDFGDGRMKEYEPAELDMLDFGYAFTVHKSQGSEYKSVIINLQCAHYNMLTRPLIYTAITRGKERVAIVGEKRALCIAIKKTDTEKRGTCLAQRLQELI